MNEAYIDVQQVLGYEFEATAFNYTDREIILYALGVGAGKNPLDLQELAFVYEGSAQGFRALPTFAVLFPGSMFQQLLKVPGIKFNLMKLLHGEQYLEILKPLPTSAQITSWGKISQVYDKGSGALIAIDVNSQDASGDLVAFNRITLFIRGIGGFGGERGPSTRDLNEAPEREPDAVWQESIPENQALLYRLSGDRNPLHADPDMAAVALNVRSCMVYARMVLPPVRSSSSLQATIRVDSLLSALALPVISFRVRPWSPRCGMPAVAPSCFARRRSNGMSLS
jgi:3-hydroxyacyl-CoA dehydrogenase/3a,7a,12a-trihydroxy-5b-cholest-24-enoyl-CoA hydratase